LWLHSLKVAQLLRTAACLHTNQSRSYLNHLVACFLSGRANLSAPLYKEQYINIQTLPTHVLSCLVPLLIECVNGACESPVYIYDVSRDPCKRSLNDHRLGPFSVTSSWGNPNQKFPRSSTPGFTYAWEKFKSPYFLHFGRYT